VIQKFSDPPLTRCSECKGTLKKLLSAPAIQFKGSGWYVTDYGKGGAGGKRDKSAEGSDKKEEKPKAETKKPKEDK
jgi:predicted nucleic acid-binding Zn ribbon protein